MNYPETLEFLYTSLPMYQRVGNVAFKKDLTNIMLLCDRLGNPQNKFKSVHIAGTNGKGSSAHMIASVIQEAGYKTGLYTSPHLNRFTERIRLNGSEIPEEDVVRFVDSIFDSIQTIEPSFFEITVAMAFWYFAEKKADIAIIEVGLGGRLDSTNIIEPLVSLITNISLDHTDMLGSSLQAIAGEKGGIIKQDTPVVIGEQNDEYTWVFREIAEQRRAPILFAEGKYVINKNVITYLNSGNMIGLDIHAWPAYQFRNLPGVLDVLEILRENGFSISDVNIKNGIENFKTNTSLKGRWQILNKRPLIVCDTAHNVGGVKLIVEEISRMKFDLLHIVWGMVKEKDVKSMLEILPMDAKYYFCKPDIPRGMDPENIGSVAREMGLDGEIIEDVMQAIKTARSRAKDEDMIFIGGSTFVVAEIEDL